MKVSNGEPYDYNTDKGEIPISLWVKKMEEQKNASVVELHIVTYIDDYDVRIDLSVPRRKWPSFRS